MESKFKKEQTPQERFNLMSKLIEPFIAKYGKPVLVHSTPETRDFEKIITEGLLKVPDSKRAKRKPHIEMMFGLYPSIFFSLGFQYASGYNFKYGLIFSLDLLKETKYYSRSISFQAYKTTALFWDKNNPEYLQMLSKKNKLSEQVVHKFYNEKFNGQTKTMFDFWKCENDVYDLIEKYPKKKELVKLYKEIAKDRFVEYPRSLREAYNDYNQQYAPEIVSLKDINILNHKSFLGFHIEGKIPKDIKKVLDLKYKGKILFDGKKIRVI